MESLDLIIQSLSIVVLLALIAFLSVATYISIQVALRLKDILAILDTVKGINAKVVDFQNNVLPQFKRGTGNLMSSVMNVLTTLLYRK